MLPTAKKMALSDFNLESEAVDRLLDSDLQGQICCKHCGKCLLDVACLPSKDHSLHPCKSSALESHYKQLGNGRGLMFVPAQGVIVVFVEDVLRLTNCARTLPSDIFQVGAENFQKFTGMVSAFAGCCGAHSHNQTPMRTVNETPILLCSNPVCKQRVLLQTSCRQPELNLSHDEPGPKSIALVHRTGETFEMCFEVWVVRANTILVDLESRNEGINFEQDGKWTSIPAQYETIHGMYCSLCENVPRNCALCQQPTGTINTWCDLMPQPLHEACTKKCRNPICTNKVPCLGMLPEVGFGCIHLQCLACQNYEEMQRQKQRFAEEQTKSFTSHNRVIKNVSELLKWHDSKVSQQ